MWDEFMLFERGLRGGYKKQAGMLLSSEVELVKLTCACGYV